MRAVLALILATRLLAKVLLATALLATTLLIQPPTPASAAVGEDAKQFASAEQILKWISNYRFEPQPEHLPAAVKAMSRHGILRDPEKAGVYVGFVAGVLGTNQLAAPKLVAKMFPMSPEQQFIIIKSIAYSGLPDWKGLLRQFIERMPAKRVLIERYMYDKEPTLLKLPLDTGPEVLDAHWGYYFATGLYEPVTRIVDALQWSTNKSDIKKLTIGSMAKWTLATNASRDKGLLDLARQELELTPRDKRAPLQEVITAAQSYETTKIRKDAIAAIEELKRNPNPGSRKWYSAANIGSTALALGCVVAGVTGHVELAVPCVITGAVSSAALKLWSNGTVESFFGGSK